MATLERAVEIAASAHGGQQDKTGAPYLLHPLRLLLSLHAAGADETAQIAAVLHDVVEDSADWTLERLESEGFSPAVVAAVDALTHRANENYDEYLIHVAANPVARQVKLADLQDNMDLRRIGSALSSRDLERVARYHAAWRMLNKGF